MKKKYIIRLSLCLILLGIGLFWYNSNSIIFNNNQTNEENNIILTSDLSDRIMLADILNYNNEIILTEDNIDNTEKIIKKQKIDTGIYIEKNSRKEFLDILNLICGKNYFKIDSYGYLKIEKELPKNSPYSEMISNYIKNNHKCLIINISDTYKKLYDNGAILDMMIEPKSYIKRIKYNNSIEVILINPEKLVDSLDNETLYMNCEEIIMNIFNHDK